MDMAKLLSGLGYGRSNFYVQMDLTDLARIVSTIIFITVDNTFYNGSVINAAVVSKILSMAHFWKTSRLRSCGSDGGFSAPKTANDGRFRCVVSVADNFDPSRPDHETLCI